MSTLAITSEVFRWAKDRANISDEKLAQIINTKIDRIIAWETGKEFPSFQQAKKIANTLSIPLGYLFLPHPPNIVIPIADFRTSAGKEGIKLSLDLLDVLDDALRKRDWYREWRKAEGFEAFGFVGRFTTSNNPEEVAEDIRHTLDIPENFVAKLRSWDEHLKFLIQKVENEGILVLQSGIVGNNTHRRLSLDDFRGFSLADDFAPLIFINSQDSIAGRIFTLVHELAHLWTGTSGISNPELHDINGGQLQIEKYCNSVASEYLVPRKIFTRAWNNQINTLANTEILAKQFRVSEQVVLRRALDNKLIQQKEYFEVQKEVLKNTKFGRKGTGGNFYNSLLSRNSKRFTNTLIYAISSGQLSYMSASRLLNTKPNVVGKLIGKI